MTKAGIFVGSIMAKTYRIPVYRLAGSNKRYSSDSNMDSRNILVHIRVTY